MQIGTMTPLQLATRASTLVVTGLMAVVAYWLQLSPEDQAKLLLAYPWLKVVTPAAGWVMFVIARVWPQSSEGGKA